MAVRTRSTRSGLTKRVPLMTCETVAIDTSATRATSFIVAMTEPSRKRLRHPAKRRRRRQDRRCATGRKRLSWRGRMGDIALEQVWKVFPDGTQAVRAVDLQIPDGALMVLVGPSGCGKTTLLRMIAGLEDVTAGSIRIGEREINDVPAKNRDIAMVFQNYALYPHMSVYDNQAFGLRLRHLARSEIDTRVRGIAGVLGLSDQLEKKPGQLSGGQRQRGAMGRAIVREPEAFLMDEPLSNLDAKLRVATRAELSTLTAELGVTTIYVTHDQVEAMTMGDRVAVMRKGELQQVASPQELYDHPVNLFVGGFIGSPAMNMLEATIERSNGGYAANLGNQKLALGQHGGIDAYVGKNVIVGIR